MAIELGDLLLNGKYQILRLIGEGGMARVWLAEELTFGRRLVALKEPRPDLLPADRDLVLRRFDREVKVCAALARARVPHIVHALTAEPAPGGLLLALDYLPGGDLAGLLKQHPSGLPLERALAIASDLLEALERVHGHELEIVHRDVKPSNVLFDAAGRAYLSDLGLAQVAGTSGELTRLLGGGGAGTPLYVAPEQEAGRGYVTPAADLYALGCVVWEMLAGKRYKRHKPGTPPSSLRGDVPGWLDAVVLKALAEDPWERWQSAGEMAAALEAGRAQEEADARARREAEARARREAEERARQEEARRRAAEEARREAEDEARRQAEEQARQERVARWYAEAVREVKANPQRSLELVTRIRLVEPGHPRLAALEGRAEAELARRQKREGRERGAKPPAWLWALGAVVLLASGLLGGLALRQCGGPAPGPTAVVQVSEPPEEPTDTALPPSHTPPPPTDTPAPPTETPVPPMPTVIPTPEAGATRTRGKDGMVMVHVPAGEFAMGSPDGEGDGDEHPRHTVYLDAFWIDRTEVTNAQYRAFVTASGRAAPTTCTWGDPTYDDAAKRDHPVVCVSWEDARAYCAWAGARLPTEAEWEKAARGTDGREYPWGDTFDGSRVNYCDANCEYNYRDSSANDGYARTAPVGSYASGASPYGALDMAGNVWEWVGDWYDAGYYVASPPRNPEGPASGQYRVLRGGSWYIRSYFVRSALRNWLDPDLRSYLIGFRCGVSSTSSP